MIKPVLGQLRRRLTAWTTVLGAARALAIAAAAALGILLIDAALDLSDGQRSAAPLALAICWCAIVIWEIRRALTLTRRRLARTIEKSNPNLGNRLSNAVDLEQRAASTAIEESLRQDAVELGRRAAEQAGAWPLFRRNAMAAGWAAVIALAAWGIMAALAPEALRAIWPRFTDPRGDHPPYSRLRITVSPAEIETLYGGQVEIHATVSGKPVDKLWLVARYETNETRAIMFLAPDHSFFQTLANLRQPAEYFVTDGAARSKRFSLRIRYTPEITGVEVTTRFPDYTGKPAHTGKLAEEPQAVPADTQITIRIASNRPLKSGQLTLTPALGGKPVQVLMKPASSQVVAGEFTLTEPVFFSGTIEDVDGLKCANAKQGKFNILPDERPRLFVIEPGQDAVATPSVRIPVRVQAEDDYAVTRVVWLRGHNHSIEQPFSMTLTQKDGPRIVQADGAFDLGKLGVRPGDVIEYYFEAADNYPKGPNVTLSKLYRLEIISDERYEEILREQAARKGLFAEYFAADSWLKRLVERSRNLAQHARRGEATEPDAENLEKEMEKYQDTLSKMLTKTARFDVENSFHETLKKQLSAESDALEKLKQARAAGATPEQLEEISKELAAMSQTVNQNVDEPAAQIAEVARLVAGADEFVQLAQQEATVAQLLRRFAEEAAGLSRVEQMEVQELAHQQRRIEQQLAGLMSSLADGVGKLPSDERYDQLRADIEGFVKGVADARIQDDASGAARALAQLDASTGQTLSQSAADKMAKFIKKCQGTQGEGQMALRFGPSVSVGNTLAQILEAMKGNGSNGKGNGSGFSMFPNDVALYGPNMERAGGGEGNEHSDQGRGNQRTERVASNASDSALKTPEIPGRVRLQPNAKFPLRYRDLVGDYFRAVAESQQP